MNPIFMSKGSTHPIFSFHILNISQSSLSNIIVRELLEMKYLQTDTEGIKHCHSVRKY